MLIDSHCHLPHKKYKKSEGEIIKEAKKEGVEKLISVGTSISESEKALEISKKHKEVYSTAGIYPHEDIGIELNQVRIKMEQLIKSSRENIVGIGECGIDIPDKKPDYETRELEDQRELFKRQVGLAVQYDLPIVIHNRNGDDEILKILKRYERTNLRGVMHCYVSDWKYAQQVLDLGFYISFTAIITYPSAGPGLIETVKKVPKAKFLLETDAPYLAPQELRGQINYPKYVKMTAVKIAEIRNTSQEKIEEITYQNTCRLFNI